MQIGYLKRLKSSRNKIALKLVYFTLNWWEVRLYWWEDSVQSPVWGVLFSSYILLLIHHFRKLFVSVGGLISCTYTLDDKNILIMTPGDWIFVISNFYPNEKVNSFFVPLHNKFSCVINKIQIEIIIENPYLNEEKTIWIIIFISITTDLNTLPC